MGDENEPDSKICFLSNYPPKECGIATFARDLSDAINKKFNPRLKSRIIALNDDSRTYEYDDKVVMEINKDDIDDYIETAKKINAREDIKLVCIQHEFGIFGGEYGNHVLPFLEALDKPVTLIFHSVLPNPDMARKRIVKSICDRSSATIVMAKKAISILRDDYGVEEEKMHFIPHGIPNVPFTTSQQYKEKLGLDGKIVLSTFGLLSRGKGVEYMIRAMPKLVEKYPNIVYLIMGETHPVIKRNEGEVYRDSLVEEVKRLGLEDNVKFYNKFLTDQEITDYLLATDVYVCTNLDKNQIVSGTLSYALGCGRVVVSTPIEYAKEFLSHERGLVVADVKSPEGYIEQIDKVLSDPLMKQQIERNAYNYGRSMIWSNVAIKYWDVFKKVIRIERGITEKFPPIKLDHLKNMTDDFGMLQFCNYSSPDPKSGYTIDDNSRALIASTLHHRIFGHRDTLALSKTYLNFMEHCQDDDGNFQNNIGNDNEIIDSHSEDSFGRTIWALGYTTNKSNHADHKEHAEKLLVKSFPIIEELGSPRAIAFSMIGLYHYYKHNPSEETLRVIKKMADFLTGCYERESCEDWNWFEDIIAYSNSKLPEALYLAYNLTKNEKYLEIAEESLAFLTELTFRNGKLCLIGQNGWCKKNGKRAFFDEQPVDASSLVHTYLTAYSITGNKAHHDQAVISLNWFYGKNHLDQMVYDETTGGCFDGIGKYSLNMNQGAESTLSYLTARLFLEESLKFEKII